MSPCSFQPFSPFLPLDVTKRNLPHWQQEGRTYFVTFRLRDSLPAPKLNQWREEKDAWFKANPAPRSDAQKAEYSRRFPQRLNDWLDAGEGSCLLKEPTVSAIVENTMRHFDGERYQLDAYVVMPNHVHVVVATAGSHTLSDVLQSWKSFTAHEINKLLKRRGGVWLDESFDHIVRSEEQLGFYRLYIGENPAKARLKSGAFRVGSGIGVKVGEKEIPDQRLEPLSE